MARPKRPITLDELRRRYLRNRVTELRQVLAELPDERQRALFNDPELWPLDEQQDQGEHEQA